MQKSEYFGSMLAGFAIGLATAIMLSPKGADRTRKRLKEISSRAGDALDEQRVVLGKWTNKGKDKVEDAADAARSVAHSFGKSMEQGGKRLQKV